MPLPLTRILIYAKNVEETVKFYQTYFGFKIADRKEEGDRIIDLVSEAGGARLLIHPASKGLRQGQACIKLIFDVEDVEGFKRDCAKKGLVFGASHQAEGYLYSNAKDPNGNRIQISGRAFHE